MKFIEECNYTLGEDEDGKRFSRVPSKSRYVKSEDILYEIKKIQQEQVLDDGYVYEHVRKGMPKGQIETLRKSIEWIFAAFGVPVYYFDPLIVFAWNIKCKDLQSGF